MHRLALLLCTVLVVAGCATASPSPLPSPSTALPATTPSSSAPSATPRPTPTPVPVANCPTGSPITALELIDSDQQCFVGEDIAVRGWLDAAPPVGFEEPLIEPRWLAYPLGSLATIWGGTPVGPDQTCVLDDHDCGWFFTHINPTSDVVLVGPPRWLIVTGHFEDPAAETCHFIYADDYTDERVDDHYAVASCRAQFVLTAVEEAP